LSNLPYKTTEAGITLAIKLAPGTSKTCVDSVIMDAKGQARLKIFLQAKPVEGEANLALTRFLAKSLKIAPSMISLLHGKMSRGKLLLLKINADTALAALKALCGE
jgi:uncharacterized protein YggU (UPF0235/DUF167 family)